MMMNEDDNASTGYFKSLNRDVLEFPQHGRQARRALIAHRIPFMQIKLNLSSIEVKQRDTDKMKGVWGNVRLMSSEVRFVFSRKASAKDAMPIAPIRLSACAQIWWASAMGRVRGIFIRKKKGKERYVKDWVKTSTSAYQRGESGVGWRRRGRFFSGAFASLMTTATTSSSNSAIFYKIPWTQTPPESSSQCKGSRLEERGECCTKHVKHLIDDWSAQELGEYLRPLVTNVIRGNVDAP
jgi:hypothetical protein